MIATATAGRAPTPTTAAPTATTAAPTGHHGGPVHRTVARWPPPVPDPHLWVVAVVGFIVLYLGSVVLALVERPRSLLRRVLRLAPPAVPAGGHGARAPAAGEPDRGPHTSGPCRPAPSRPIPKAGGSPGLWFDGWEPQGRNRD